MYIKPGLLADSAPSVNPQIVVVASSSNSAIASPAVTVDDGNET